MMAHSYSRGPLLAMGMSHVIHVDQLFRSDVGIALGCAYGTVAQHLLYHAHVCPVGKQGCSKGMAEGMRIHVVVGSF